MKSTRKIEVANMKWWNSELQRYVILPTKRVTAGIGSKIFEVIEGTRQRVDKSLIDEQGRLLIV